MSSSTARSPQRTANSMGSRSMTTSGAISPSPAATWKVPPSRSRPVKKPSRRSSRRQPRKVPLGGGGNGSPELKLTDEELLERVRQSKNGPRFRAMFDEGECPKVNKEGKPDHSDAHLQLLGILAWWTRKNPQRMERYSTHPRFGAMRSGNVKSTARTRLLERSAIA